MGSISAMNSLNRVIEKHGDELAREVLAGLPRSLVEAFRLTTAQVSLENNLYTIEVAVQLPDESLSLKPYDIDELGERYPDCDVGY